MIKHIKKWCICAMPAIVGMVMGVSCNSKEDPTGTYETSSSVAVTGFYIKANAKVMANLDSVFFSIDLDKQVIFNADSLPKGTDVRKLVAVISYPSGVQSATIDMTGGEYRTGTIDYKTNPSDSIDFTGKVTLRLLAEDGVTSRNYDIKVNVHKMNPDSLMWDKMSVTKLPSRNPSPKASAAVKFNDMAYCLVQENDDTYTMAYTANPASGEWTKEQVGTLNDVNMQSLCAADDAMYVITNQGELIRSEDGIHWQYTDRIWFSLIGGYGNSVLGVVDDGANLRYAKYPDDPDFVGEVVDPKFPLHGTSNFVTFTNKWSVQPVGFIVGGEDLQGNRVADTWGFDGDTWTSISVNTTPALQGALLVPYYTYRQTSTMWIQTEIGTWLLMGGIKEDGSVNRDVYVSYDNGVNWRKASQSLQLPDYLPDAVGMSSVVLPTSMSGSLTANWESRASQALPPGMRRLTYDVNGYDVTWECPYIYLFGGIAGGKPSDTIWRGVLTRLTFMPLL